MIRLSLYIFLGILISPLWTSGEEAATPTEKIFTIGVPGPLSGDAATYGIDIRNSILFANEKIGGGHFKLIFEDDKCTGKDAVTVANKFVHIDKVDAVIGIGCSGAALPATSVYEHARVPVVISSASSPKIADAGDYIFRTTPSDKKVAEVLFNRIKQKYLNVGILAEETQYAQDLKESFLSFAHEGKLQTKGENYLPGSFDVKAQLLRLKDAKVDSLLMIPQTEYGTLQVLKGVRQIKWNAPLYTAYWAGASSFLDVAGDEANGIEFGDLPAVSSIVNADGKSFYDEFKQKYGGVKSYEMIFATTFEAFRAMSQALLSGKDIRDYLYHTKFNGIFGPYSFDEKGEIVGLGAVLKRIEDRKPVVISIDAK